MRPPLVCVKTKLVSVSIHASVKDATVNVRYDALNMPVSIHASVKDATNTRNNPFILNGVSIHASVKDATVNVGLWRLLFLFQSTHL